MKQKLTFLVAAICIAAAVNAQKNKKNTFKPGQIKPALFGLSYSLTDFNAPKNFNNSNATTLPISEMSSGVAIQYMQGITPFIDFAARFNGIFHNYSSDFSGKPATTEIGLEFEPSVNIRPIKDENKWAPYLNAGVGIGLYTNKLGAYIPLGGGLQVNASNVAYFFLQANYKWSITPNVVGNNLYYSIGFAKNISGK
jgi:OmpA-OmpF porin, OOP family